MLPHDAERAVLGALLHSYDAIAPKVPLVVEDFDDNLHRRIYRTIQKLAAGKVTPDIMTVASELNGDKAYVAGLTDAMALEANITHCVKAVRDGTNRRTLQQLAKEMARDAARPGLSLDAILTTVEATVADMRRPVEDVGPDLGITSRELLAMEIPEPVWIVPDILTEGVGLLAGAPKTGKSWLALQLGAALSVGTKVLGSIDVPKICTLYLALEDNDSSLQERLNTIGALPSDNLRLRWDWEPGLDVAVYLGRCLGAMPEIKFVIVDTLQIVRKPSQWSRNPYELDYDEIGRLRQVAKQYRVAILILHHTKKAISDDIVAMVSGTYGLSGAADTVLVLTRGRGEADAELFVTGRRVREQQLALRFDEAVGWVVLGDAREWRQSEARRAILDIIKGAGEEGVALGAIVKEIGGDKAYSTVSNLVRKMAMDGNIKQMGRGVYRCIP